MIRRNLGASVSLGEVTEGGKSRLRPNQTLAAGMLVVGLMAAACGSPRVGAESTQAESSSSFTPTPPPAQAVYYQPRLADLHSSESFRLPPTDILRLLAEPGHSTTWTDSSGNCLPQNATKFLDAPDDPELWNPNAHTLVGFSLGRIGAWYFLRATTPEQRQNVRNITVVAPGNAEDFNGSCDPQNGPELLESWLGENPANRFTVIADQRTAENDYEGVRGLYLNALADAVAASQINLCASNIGHEETWNAVKAQVLGGVAGCPANTQAISFS